MSRHTRALLSLLLAAGTLAGLKAVALSDVSPFGTPNGDAMFAVRASLSFAAAALLERAFFQSDTDSPDLVGSVPWLFWIPFIWGVTVPLDLFTHAISGRATAIPGMLPRAMVVVSMATAFAVITFRRWTWIQGRGQGADPGTQAKWIQDHRRWRPLLRSRHAETDQASDGSSAL